MNIDDFPDRLNWTWGMKEGVIEVHELGTEVDFIQIPRQGQSSDLLDTWSYLVSFLALLTLHESTSKFIAAYLKLLHVMNNGNVRSYCWRRLQFLTHKFHLHFLLNANLETNIQKELPHRDFYNCRKARFSIIAFL